MSGRRLSVSSRTKISSWNAGLSAPPCATPRSTLNSFPHLIALSRYPQALAQNLLPPLIVSIPDSPRPMFHRMEDRRKDVGLAATERTSPEEEYTQHLKMLRSRMSAERTRRNAKEKPIARARRTMPNRSCSAQLSSFRQGRKSGKSGCRLYWLPSFCKYNLLDFGGGFELEGFLFRMLDIAIQVSSLVGWDKG